MSGSPVSESIGNAFRKEGLSGRQVRVSVLYLSNEEKVMRTWLRHWPIAALAVGAIVVGLRGTVAQTPSEGKARDGEEKPRTDAALDEWVKTLAQKMTDRHDSIRHSARIALVTIGQPALPILRKLEKGEDGATAEAARKVVRHIERRRHWGRHHRAFRGRHPGIHRGWQRGPGFGRP